MQNHTYNTWFAILSTILITGLLLWFGHRVFWWYADDGVFAYLAEVIVQGGVFGKDIFDIHGGYHAFVSAWAFSIFGSDIVVLRYPVIALCLIQAAIVSYMLRRQGTAISILGGVSVVTLGYLTYPNPSPSWYTLAFATLVVFLLTETKNEWWKYGLTGLLIGIVFMFRHPSAVFLAMGVGAYLLSQTRQSASKIPFGHVGFKAACGVLACGVLLYSLKVFEITAFIFFALPPLGLLWMVVQKSACLSRAFVSQALALTAGFLVGVLPMVLYVALYGDVTKWLHTSFLSGLSIADTDYFHQQHYIIDMYRAVQAAEGVTALLSIGIYLLYWIILLALPLLIVGIALYQWRVTGQLPTLPSVYVAVFYALVSFYFQIPFYLFISIPLTVLAFLQISAVKLELQKTVFWLVIILNLMVAIPQSQWFLAASNPQAFVESRIPKVSLLIRKESHQQTMAVWEMIQAHTEQRDAIFVFPLGPVHYFVSDRKNLFPDYGLHEITSEEIFTDRLATIDAAEPKLVIFDTSSKLWSEYDDRLVAWFEADPRYISQKPFTQYGFFVHVDASTSATSSDLN